MRVFWVVACIVVVDQITKVWVRTSMYLGESIPVWGDVLRLTFTENPGMAFGITFGVPLLVTVFSIIATVLILLYLIYLRNANWAYRTGLALILGGAVGNIIDRVFYAKIFNYGGLFRGQVVDFIHVDLWRGVVADWVPLVGGKYLALFPIWNVADMSIVVGVVMVLLFQRRLAPATPVASTPESVAEPAEAIAPQAAPEPPLAGA